MPIYGRFLLNGAPRHAQIELQAPAQIEGAVAHFVDDLFGSATRTGEVAPVAELTILPPVVPSKVFAIGLNYADHAREHGNEVPPHPLMWFKAPSSLLEHGGTIELALPSHRTDYEAELALVIGKRCKAVSEDEAKGAIWGITNAQDVSDRVIQRGESQWARAKSLDTYCPLGPFIYTDVDFSALRVQSLVNGSVRQDGNTRDLMFSPAKIVAFLSEAMTLEAGDVILTGTPEGVGPLRDGDELETRIGDLVPLLNRVKYR